MSRGSRLVRLIAVSTVALLIAACGSGASSYTPAGGQPAQNQGTATTNGTMTVTVQSGGLSLLAPTLTVYNSSQTQIGFASGAGQYGTTVSVPITGVSAGQQFYVKVGGADTTAFATGHYALTFAFAGIAPPAVSLPKIRASGGMPSGSSAIQTTGPRGRTGKVT